MNWAKNLEDSYRLSNLKPSNVNSIILSMKSRRYSELLR
jgi:hypothetical protein